MGRNLPYHSHLNSVPRSRAGRDLEMFEKEIQPVHPKGDQSWALIGGTDAEAESSILWPPHAKNWLIGKDSEAGRDWGQEEKGTTEDEMTGWHHWLDGHEFEWTPGVGDGQGGLACCNSWGRKESDMTEWLNWTELNWESEQYPERSLGAVTLGSKISKVLLLFSMFLLLLLFFLYLHTAPSLSTKPRSCCFSLFMRMTRGLNHPWICASTFLYAIIWKHTIKPLKVTADITGYSSLQCNVKSLTVQFLKYLSHIDMVYNICPFFVL